MSVSLLQLRTRVYDLMDEGASQYVSTTQANDQINNAYGLLFNKYARADETLTETDYIFTPTDSTRDYALPTNFKRLLRAAVLPVLTGTVATQYHIPMMRTGQYYGGTPTGYYPPTGLVIPTYELLGSNIRLNPTPIAPISYQVALWYKAKAVALASDGATLDAMIDDAHAQWIVLYACIQLRTKEEQPSSDLQASLALVEAELDADLAQRDMYDSKDIVMSDNWDGYL